MDLRLDETQEAIVATFSDYLTEHCTSEIVRQAEAESGLAEALWDGFVELGAPAMGVAEANGGVGLGLLELGLVALEAGRALAPVPFVETAVSARLVESVAVDSPLLPAICEGRAIASLAIDRPHAIKGTLGDPATGSLVPFGAIADTIIAPDGSGLLAISTSSDTSGPGDRRRAIDLAGGAHASVAVDSSRHGSERLAEGDGSRAAHQRAELEWRLLSAFSLVGMAKGALDIGARYACDRIQFGRPIGAFQGVAHPLADCATRVDGAELLAMEAAWSSEAEPERFAGLCEMALAWAGRTAIQTAGTSLHTHGGYGFSTEYDIQLYYRRARALSSLAGGSREGFLAVGEAVASGSLALQEAGAPHGL